MRSKELISRILSILMIAALMLTYMPASAFAESEADASADDNQYYSGNTESQDDGDTSTWYLSEDHIYMDYDPDNYDPWYLYAYVDDDTWIDSVTSSDPDVVSVGGFVYAGDNEYFIELYREGGGEAVISVYDGDGNCRECEVTSEETPYRLNYKSITFNKKNMYSEVWLGSCYYGKDREIVEAVSSNKKVVSVTIDQDSGMAIVKAKKPGKATITVTDRSGKAAKVPVKIAKSWKKANLKLCSQGFIYYSSKKVYIYSKPKTKVTLKIGGKTYKTKVSKYGSAIIKLKKHYKVKTKYTLTFKNGGVKAVLKGKVQSDTSACLRDKIWTCKNYVPVVVYNVVKGDKLYVTVNGKTYKKKITNSGNFYTTIYTDDNLGYVRSIKYKVKNKYKQTLYSGTEYINW